MSEPVAAAATLPREPRGRSLAWGGMALLVAIELTVMGSLVMSYFYLRVNSTLWPPPDVDLPRLLLPSVETGLLVASAVPLLLGERARARGHARPLGWLLPVAMALIAASLAVKAVELSRLPYAITSHAYGSAVWTLHGYSALHEVALFLALGVLWLLVLRGALDGKARGAAAEALALYTYFVAASGVLVFATTTLSPHLL